MKCGASSPNVPKVDTPGFLVGTSIDESVGQLEPAEKVCDDLITHPEKLHSVEAGNQETRAKTSRLLRKVPACETTQIPGGNPGINPGVSTKWMGQRLRRLLTFTETGLLEKLEDEGRQKSRLPRLEP